MPTGKPCPSEPESAVSLKSESRSSVIFGIAGSFRPESAPPEPARMSPLPIFATALDPYLPHLQRLRNRPRSGASKTLLFKRFSASITAERCSQKVAGISHQSTPIDPILYRCQCVYVSFRLRFTRKRPPPGSSYGAPRPESQEIILCGRRVFIQDESPQVRLADGNLD